MSVVNSYYNGVNLCCRVRLYIIGRFLHCGTYLCVIGIISILWGKSGHCGASLFIVSIMRHFCSIWCKTEFLCKPMCNTNIA